MVLALAGVTAIVAVADRRGLMLAPPVAGLSDYAGEVRVTRVVDGDTIDVAIPDASTGEPFTRVRIWGIDCPEMPGPERDGEPFANEARAASRRLVLDERVRLTIEPTRMRDRYGRLLAHVDLPDGRGLAVLLLEEGLAIADDRWPHARLLEHAEAERRAQWGRIGIWSRTLHTPSRGRSYSMAPPLPPG